MCWAGSYGRTPREWTAARERLTVRILVGADGTATEAGRDLRRRVERDTDRLALGPRQAFGPEGTERLAALLGDHWGAVLGSGRYPVGAGGTPSAPPRPAPPASAPPLPSESTLGIGEV